MKPPITISRATAVDLNAIHAIERGCFDDDAFSRRQLSYLVGKAQGGCYIARIGGRVAGYIACLTRRNTRNLRIYSVAVAADARGQGVGQAMIEQAISIARTQGLGEVTLEVRTNNTAARALYASHGFGPDRLIPNYYHDGTDAQRMVLTLGR